MDDTIRLHEILSQYIFYSRHWIWRQSRRDRYIGCRAKVVSHPPNPEPSDNQSFRTRHSRSYRRHCHFNISSKERSRIGIATWPQLDSQTDWLLQSQSASTVRSSWLFRPFSIAPGRMLHFTKSVALTRQDMRWNTTLMNELENTTFEPVFQQQPELHGSTFWQFKLWNHFGLVLALGNGTSNLNTSTLRHISKYLSFSSLFVNSRQLHQESDYFGPFTSRNARESHWPYPACQGFPA